MSLYDRHNDDEFDLDIRLMAAGGRREGAQHEEHGEDAGGTDWQATCPLTCRDTCDCPPATGRDTCRDICGTGNLATCRTCGETCGVITLCRGNTCADVATCDTCRGDTCGGPTQCAKDPAELC